MLTRRAKALVRQFWFNSLAENWDVHATSTSELSFCSRAITYPATLRQVAEAEAGRAMNGGGVAPARRLTARCFQAPHRRRDGATPPRPGDNYRQLSTSFYANLYSP